MSSRFGMVAFAFLLAITSAQAQSVASNTPQWFGAKGDGVSDDTTALQAWANSLSNNKSLSCPAGDYIFKNTITFPSGLYHVAIKCDQAIFRYTGTYTNINLFVAGTTNQGCSNTNWVFEDFSVKANTVMAAGDAFKLNDFCASELRNISIGRDLNGDNKLWNGLHFNGGNSVHYKGSGASAQNIAMIVNGDTTTQFTDFWLDGGVLLTSGTGLVIGGNVGGFEATSADILENSVNVKINQTQISRPNIQIFFGSNVSIDATRAAPNIGILVDDPGFINSYLYFSGTWVASAQGSCIVVNGDQWQVNYTGGNIGNCGASGYYQVGNHVHSNFVGTYIWGNQYGLNRAAGSTGTMTVCGIRMDRNTISNVYNFSGNGSSCGVP